MQIGMQTLGEPPLRGRVGARELGAKGTEDEIMDWENASANPFLWEGAGFFFCGLHLEIWAPEITL